VPALPSHSTSGKEPLIPIEQEAGWGSGAVWIFWKLKSPVSAKNHSGHCTACNIITVLIMLMWHPINS
jgi:hypothetical protein